MRPARPARRMRPVTRSTSATSVASISSRLRVRRPSARCEPIEPRRRPVRTRRRSWLCASAWRCLPDARPSIATSASCGNCGHLADRPDPAVVQALCGLRSDAPQTLDRERMEEVELAVGWHDEQAVRLGDPARDLGEELRPRHADRDRETDAVAHIPTQARRDLGRRPGDPPHATDVEERLVDRQPFDERRRVLEDLEHRLAGLGVRRHPRGDDDRVGAESTRVPPAHRRSDAVRLGLVARREHDACPDDHGTAAQACVVPLLDRREERVDVGVQDGRLHTNTCSQEDIADARVSRRGSARRRQPLSAVAQWRAAQPGRPDAGHGLRAE